MGFAARSFSVPVFEKHHHNGHLNISKCSFISLLCPHPSPWYNIAPFSGKPFKGFAPSKVVRFDLADPELKLFDEDLGFVTHLETRCVQPTQIVLCCDKTQEQATKQSCALIAR